MRRLFLAIFISLILACNALAGIVSSSYVVDQTPQADGRRWVKETHIDSVGKSHYAEYLASEGTDYQAVLEARAANIGEELDRLAAISGEAANTQINYRRIRPDAFRDRFNFLTEKLKVKTSQDPIIQLFMDEVNGRPYIGLDHPLVQQAMPYLRDHEILDGATPEERQSRMEYLLRDGTAGEM
ncbi:MAG: hypothetical protein WA151_11335 [Desulfatirhabdiaceae bacterium]